MGLSWVCHSSMNPVVGISRALSWSQWWACRGHSCRGHCRGHCCGHNCRSWALSWACRGHYPGPVVCQCYPVVGPVVGTVVGLVVGPVVGLSWALSWAVVCQCYPVVGPVVGLVVGTVVGPVVGTVLVTVLGTFEFAHLPHSSQRLPYWRAVPVISALLI